MSLLACEHSFVTTILDVPDVVPELVGERLSVHSNHAAILVEGVGTDELHELCLQGHLVDVREGSLDCFLVESVNITCFRTL